MPLPSRVVDYVVVLRVAQTKVESGGRFKQVGLPLVNALRYPINDWKDAEFPSDLGCFAFPDGARFETDQNNIATQEYSFVLTEGDGTRIYIQALRYWQETKANDAAIYNKIYDIENGAIFEPFIIVIVSHWAFYREFDLILKRLFEVTQSGGIELNYSIEECLTNLIYFTPLPPRGRRYVEFNCYNKKIYFKRAAPNEHSLKEKDISILFHTLSVNNILTIIIAMLCEKRLLFYSIHIQLLTPCIQSLCSLIFPFYWQHIYVPVLPAKFTDFIYAPMPFICGVLPSYLPDLSLLEGVVFVDLDNNVVKFHSSDPIAKFSPISNHKEINKLVSNPKKPLNMNVNIDEKEVANAFIKLFAKLMKSYKICMNPSMGPSKDKFNKEKYVNDVLNERESDKEKNQKFLNLFVEAQLFQCFIDERFDFIVDSDQDHNYDVLYFDEKIDQIIHNKSTPFLLDTTFLPKKKDTYIVPIPSSSAAEAYSYNEFPLILNEKLCVVDKNKLAPILVTQQDLNEQQSMHISWMSVEFFKQKRLYDRHFHSLESRINSQNILFRQILQFFMKWMDSNHKYITDLEVITQSISNSNIINISDKSSLDEPWAQFKKYIENYCTLYRDNFYESKKKSFMPIMEAVGSKENELSVIIQTARNCESTTAKTKCEVEFANKNVLKYTKRLKDKQSQLESHHNLKLDEFINAVENKDKYEIEHVESTTTFLTNLEIFTTSMPTMIDDVQTISNQRLLNFKQYLHAFISSNRSMHQRFANELQSIEQLIEQINPQQDIEKSVKGKPKKKETKKEEVLKNMNHTNTKKRRYSISRELSQIGMTRLQQQHVSIANIYKEKEKQAQIEEEEEEKEKQQAAKEQSVAVAVIKEEEDLCIITDDHGIDRVNGSILYSDNLWGTKKFQMVLRQCEDGKNVIKLMVKAMEDLNEVFDLQSKSLLRCTQSMKKNLKLSGKESKVWQELYSLTEKSSFLYKSAVAQVRLSVFELKIMKGELKSISKLLQRKKGEIGSEVQFATRAVQIARDERHACKRIYQHTQSQWNQVASETYNEHELKPLLHQMASAQLNFQQSDMKWNRSKGILRSVKQKEDLCNGVILDTFREKEIKRQSQIIKSITHLCCVVFKLIYGIHEHLNKFMKRCQSLNVEQQINSFIDREITSSAAMLDRENIRWTAKSVQLSWISSKNAIDSAKAMLDFFLCRVSAAEQYSRHFSRRSASEHIHNHNNDDHHMHLHHNNNNVNNMQCKFGYSLNDLFLNFNKYIYDVSAISLDFLFAIQLCIEPALNEIKKCMEHQNIASHQLISECNTDFNKLEEKLAKSVIECRRLETQIDGLKQRIFEKENKNKNKSDKDKTKTKQKKRTFKIFEKSKEQLQTELSSTQNKLKQEISNRDRLKSQLQQKSKYRDVLFSKVITDFIRHEEYRLKMNKYIYCIYSKITEESLLKMHSLTVELKNNVQTINIKNNIQKFVLQNRSSQNVPKIVLDHAIFKMSQEKHAIFDKIIKDVEKMLLPYQEPYDRLNNKLIFNHEHEEHQQLLTLKKKKHIKDIDLNNNHLDDHHNNYNHDHYTQHKIHAELLNVSLHYSNDTEMTLPKMKEGSSNQEISKHLLAYVTKHSMKGGKHARIDSLHSISRSHQKKFRKNANLNNANIAANVLREDEEQNPSRKK